MLVSLMLAAKTYDDEYFENKYYARVGGITNQEINLMELEFAKKMKFNLFVS